MNELITEQTAVELFDGLLKWDAFEIEIIESSEHTGNDGGQTVLIPYVMNDAVEYFLSLPDCVVRGDWDYESEVNKEWDIKYGTAKSYTFISDDKVVDDNEEDHVDGENNNRKGLILRQESGNTITIWYHEILRSATCYQYHMIGHNWRKKKGEEHLRRLVNLVCVLHDKFTYLGDEFCTGSEWWLAHLAEFGPLRYFTPINQSIDPWYEETLEGCDSMLQLAVLAGDQDLIKSVKRYANALQGRGVSARMIKNFAMKFLEKEHRGIYESLLEEITKASLAWEEREYAKLPVSDEAKILVGEEKKDFSVEDIRKKVEEAYRKKNYIGDYPRMNHADGREVQFVEEHPFTTLESDDYRFVVYSLHFQDGDYVEMKKE